MKALQPWLILVLCAGGGYAIVAILFDVLKGHGKRQLSAGEPAAGPLAGGSEESRGLRARAILEIAPWATEPEIRTRYLEMMAEHDPQRREFYTDALKRAAEQKTRDLTWAYGVLVRETPPPRQT